MPASPRRGASTGIRRTLATALALLLAAATAPAAAEGTKVKVGVLQLTSSAPIFLGVERGTFREFGIEPELVYFQAASAFRTRTGTAAGRGGHRPPARLVPQGEHGHGAAPDSGHGRPLVPGRGAPGAAPVTAPARITGGR